MDGADRTILTRESEAATSAHPVAGIFLHAGWRSCGTWMWERLREQAHVQAFYEPLHEDLATLRPRDIGLLRPDNWLSGHGSSAPYFAEYAPLLGTRGGVQGHAARFAFDEYFRAVGDDDPGLKGYVRGLMASAAMNGRLPVLKFCRSLGRVPWFEARFPDVLHAVVVRSPQSQWRSARRQMEQNGNGYFVVAPFVILARNPSSPVLAEAAQWLGVRLPPGLGRVGRQHLSVTADACWRHVSRLTWQDRFRGFLALWVASGLTSLQGRATLIDADTLGDDTQARSLAEVALTRAAGLPVDLTPGELPEGKATPFSEAEAADAASAAWRALNYLEECAKTLAPERLAVLTSKLGSFAALPDDIGNIGAHKPSRRDYVDAAAYIAMMRASYPLRRAHFYLRRWLDRERSWRQ